MKSLVLTSTAALSNYSRKKWFTLSLRKIAISWLSWKNKMVLLMKEKLIKFKISGKCFIVREMEDIQMRKKWSKELLKKIALSRKAML